MNKFEERKKNFEKKFQIDQELKFKVESRSNKYLGEWVCSQLGKAEEVKNQYIQEIIKADMVEAGKEDVFRKIQADLKGHNISDDDIRKKMHEFNEKAKSEFI